MQKLRGRMIWASCVFWSMLYHFFRHERKDKKKKYILIPFCGMIGDAVLFLDALQGYQELYSAEQGYQLVVGCCKSVMDLYQSIGLGKDVEFILLDRPSLYKKSGEFRRTLKRIAVHSYEIIIHVRARSAVEDCLIYALKAKRKVVFRNKEDFVESSVKRYFFEHTYDAIVYSDCDTDQYGRYGKLLRKLGNTKYKSHIARIPKLQRSVSNRGKYFVFAVGSNENEKCWTAESFAQIADYMIQVYKIPIYFLGRKEDEQYSNKVISKMRTQNFEDFTGKTGTKEWIELIRGAVLVVANDSATIHIAASVQTPSICIAPQHDGYRFLPYQPDVVYDDDFLPVIVRCKKVPCFDCRLGNRKVGHSNSECKKNMREGKPSLCIESITVQEVQEAVENVMMQIWDDKR